VLAEDAIHVVPARTDGELARGQRDREAAVVLRTTARPDHVARLDPDPSPDDLALLVPVRRRRDAALLAEHARVVLARVERLAIEVALHRALPSARVEDARLETEPETLVEPDRHVRPALWREQVVEGPHLGSVVAAGEQLECAAQRELAVRGTAVAGGGELRLDPGGIGGTPGLAGVPARRARSRRHVTEPDASPPPPLGVHPEEPRDGLREARPGDRGPDPTHDAGGDPAHARAA